MIHSIRNLHPASQMQTPAAAAPASSSSTASDGPSPFQLLFGGASTNTATSTPQAATPAAVVGGPVAGNPATTVPTPESAFGDNPWMANPTGSGLGQSWGYNPQYFATAQTAQTVANMVGGTVVQANEMAPNGPLGQDQPNEMVKLPNGGMINPGLVAGFLHARLFTVDGRPDDRQRSEERLGFPLTAQYFQIPRHRFDAPVEIGQMELLVGRVQIVVGKSEAHHHARNAQVLVEYAHNRNRPARADVHRLLAEDLLHGVGGRMNEAVVGIRQRRRAGVEHLQFGRHSLGTALSRTAALQLLRRFIGTLIGHQPRADLRHRARRNHRLRAFAREAAANAVHLERGPRPRRARTAESRARPPVRARPFPSRCIPSRRTAAAPRPRAP